MGEYPHCGRHSSVGEQGGAMVTAAKCLPFYLNNYKKGDISTAVKES